MTTHRPSKKDKDAALDATETLLGLRSTSPRTVRMVKEIFLARSTRIVLAGRFIEAQSFLRDYAKLCWESDQHPEHRMTPQTVRQLFDEALSATGNTRPSLTESSKRAHGTVDQDDKPDTNGVHASTPKRRKV